MNINQYQAEFRKLFNSVNSLKRPEALAYFLVAELVYLYLVVEEILVDSKFKKNIFTEPLFILRNINLKILNFKKISHNFSDTKTKTRRKDYDKIHKEHFQKLWINFSKKQFINDRLNPYIKRIKINKLIPLIKGKKCIDFGCGHGQFLMALKKLGAEYCLGLDFGKSSVQYANRMSKILKFDQKKIKYIYCDAANAKSIKNESFDFAIQNGVFHHIINNKKEIKAYKEVYRVLKKGGYFFIQTAGAGQDNLRTATLEYSTKILKKFGEENLRSIINEYPLSNNKKYMIRDNFIAKYKNTTWKKYIKFLRRIGFKFVRPLRGHAKTDFDTFFSKDKLFKKKFGEGHIRLLCKKI